MSSSTPLQQVTPKRGQNMAVRIPQSRLQSTSPIIQKSSPKVPQRAHSGMSSSESSSPVMLPQLKASPIRSSQSYASVSASASSSGGVSPIGMSPKNPSRSPSRPYTPKIQRNDCIQANYDDLNLLLGFKL